jgi:G:T/U-mismatch repair DNA glycosylase
MIENHPYKTKSGLRNQLKISEEEIEKKGFKNGGIWFSNTEIIIMGTFPPREEYLNRLGYIHYSSPRNKFWKHIDSIFNKNLFFNSQYSKISSKRIANSLEKIEFLESINTGFIDIFTIIDRKVNDAKDTNLIPIETIFDTEVISLLIESHVTKIIFVYSLARDTFFEHLKRNFNLEPKLISLYNTNDIPMEIHHFEINQKCFQLVYSPIHGNITDIKRRKALKKALSLK